MYFIMWLSPNTPTMLPDQQLHAESGYTLTAKTLTAKLSAVTSDFSEVCNISAAFDKLWGVQRDTEVGWTGCILHNEWTDEQNVYQAVLFMED